MATIIVDELLCFISNKIDYVTCEELVALCTKAFTAVNIKESKLTLFNTCQRGPSDTPSETGIKYRSCRGDSSNENNVKDMITLFQELGATAPKFAAVNLNLIPVVSADKVDVSALFQMVTKLSNEVGRISQAMYKQSDGMRALQSSVEHNTSKVVAATAASYADKARQPAVEPAKRRSSSVDPEGNLQHSSKPITNENPHRRDLDEETRHDEEWNDVNRQRRRRRRRPLKTGQLIRNSDDRVPNIVGIKRTKTAELFVTRLAPECTADDLKSYILANLNLDATVKKIDTARNAEHYSSFHISCICNDPKVFYDENLWPEHVLYRRWYPPRLTRPRGISKPNAGN